MNAASLRLDSDPPSLAELERRALALLPTLRERATATEQRRSLPAETLAELLAAGFHRLYLPRERGGFECDWGAHYALSRILGRACGSSAWITSLVFSHILFLARFPADAQDEVFAREAHPLVATGSAGGGRLYRDGGRWQFAGRWGWVSGVEHAHCAMVTGTVGEGSAPTHFVLLLPGEYAIEDTWHAEGLRGTGSHHIRVADRPIPDHRVMDLFEIVGRESPGAALYPGWLYRARMAPLQKSWFAGPLVGTTRGALEEFVSRTRSRRGQIMGESVADKNAVQVETGESFAELDTAELLATEMCARLGAAGRAGADFVGEDLLWLRRASAMVARLCSAATGRLAAGLGASGQVGNHPVYRLYRDCRMVASHVELNWQHCMGLTGRHALGIATGDPLIDGPVRSAVPGGVAAAPRRLDTQI